MCSFNYPVDAVQYTGEPSHFRISWHYWCIDASLTTDTVHVIPLGEGNMWVSVNVPKLKKAALPIPTYEATTMEVAVNGFVPWSKTLVELNMSMNKASRGSSHFPDQDAEGNKCQKKAWKKTYQLLNWGTTRWATIQSFVRL